MFIQDDSLSANWIFSLWCVPLKKFGSLNWPWSTNILGQFVTCMHKFIGQSDVKHIMTSLINNNVSSEGLDSIIINIPARPVGFAEILPIMSVSTFKIDVILYSLRVQCRQVWLYYFSTLIYYDYILFYYSIFRYRKQPNKLMLMNLYRHLRKVMTHL